MNDAQAVVESFEGHFGEVALSDHQRSYLAALITAALNAREREVWEKAVQIVNEEPELPGPIPEEMYEYIRQLGIEQVLRCLVKSTKGQIVKDLKFHQQA